MGTTVSIKEVVEALEPASDQMSSYVNRATGQVITVTHEDLRLAEEDPDPDMPAWQQEGSFDRAARISAVAADGAVGRYAPIGPNDDREHLLSAGMTVA